MDAKTDAAATELTLTRVFDAPPELVFRAWTERDRFARWMGPKGFTVTFCELDASNGGAYRACMRSPEGKDHWVTGVFREVAPPGRLVFTWAWEDENGKPGHESLVTITLAAEGAKTRLTLRHTGFESESARNSHKDGWNGCLDCLAEYLAA